MTLSIIIITKNEAASIRRCLESVAWAGEIVVLDSGSGDETARIAGECGAKVHTASDWPGYGPQKNRALAFATGDWVLSLDADEWITPGLRAEIERALASSGDLVAFKIPRLSSYCGRFMRHSGWWPDHVTRLFRRGRARFSDDLVHERLIVDGAVGTLHEPLQHEAIRDLDDALVKMNAYSTAGATMQHARGKTASLTGAVWHGAWTFFRTYILRAGFLDGREGFMLAVSNAEGAYYRYLKLLLLAEKREVKTAVIVTTYNRPDALAAVLAGYQAQRNAEFELIVADDGSTDDTRRVVENFKTRVAFPIAHVWHEDRGFRAAAIRNRALTATRADYILFTDGDCVPAPDFVAQHRRLAERGWFVAGNRILLSEQFTRRALVEKLPLHEWTPGTWLAAWMRRDINRWLPLVALPDGRFRKMKPQRWSGVKTCNLAAWRDDLSRVNGLDETYSGWGLEDSDLVIRLLHAGVKHKSARFAAPLFHLWHPENDRGGLPDNQRRLDAVLRSDRVRAQTGLDQYA